MSILFITEQELVAKGPILQNYVSSKARASGQEEGQNVYKVGWVDGRHTRPL